MNPAHTVDGTAAAPPTGRHRGARDARMRIVPVAG